MVRPSVRGREIGGCGPGGDLLFRRLSGSTIGAEGFHGRVRDGIGCLAPRYGHQAGQAPPFGVPLGLFPRGCRGGERCEVMGRSVSGGCRAGRLCERGSWRCTRAVAGAFPAERGSAAVQRVAPGLRRDQTDRAISTGQLRGLLRFHLRPIDVVVFHGSQRDLVLRRVSRLDAFSGYPVRT